MLYNIHFEINQGRTIATVDGVIVGVWYDGCWRSAYWLHAGE